MPNHTGSDRSLWLASRATSRQRIHTRGISQPTSSGGTTPISQHCFDRTQDFNDCLPSLSLRQRLQCFLCMSQHAPRYASLDCSCYLLIMMTAAKTWECDRNHSKLDTRQVAAQTDYLSTRALAVQPSERLRRQPRGSATPPQ
jgi:hypothetical protein